MKIAIYTRISTDEKHQPYSLDAQSHRLAAYVESQENWQIVRRFTDQKSGATLERPGLERALREADAKRFDLLLVYRVDRLARSVRGLAQILERLDAADVLFRSATEPFDTSSSAGRMMVQMLGVFAEFERATIVERIVAGMERKAARGEWTAGRIPYGYQLDEDRRFLTPNPAEAPVIRLIFERYAQQRDGSAAIALWLSDRGYRTRKGKPFSFKAVLEILRNRTYLGEIFFRGTYYPGPHPPLVEPLLFQQVQTILEERGEDASQRRSNQSDYLLTGRIRCAHCGKRYLGAAAHGNGGRYSYYVCFSRQRYGRQSCQGDRLPAEQLEDAILNQLVALLRRSDFVQDSIAEALAERDTERPDRQAEINNVAAEIKSTDTALERYFAAFEAGSLPESACGERIAELNRRLTGLRARHHELLLDQQDDPNPEPPTKEDLQALHAHVGEVIRDGDPPARKALLQALVGEIRVVSKAEIYPTFSLPAVVRPPTPLVPPTGFEPVLPP
jgi:site-specific DNA recombinase